MAKEAKAAKPAKTPAEVRAEDIVRRDHINRQKAGPKALEKLVEKDTRKRDERRKLAHEVGLIGAANRKAAQKAAKEAAKAG